MKPERKPPVFKKVRESQTLFTKTFYNFLFSFVGVIGTVLVIVLLIGVQLGG
jgi:hypothetical protein